MPAASLIIAAALSIASPLTSIAPRLPAASLQPTQPPQKPISRLGPDGYRISNSLIDPIQDGTQGAKLELANRAVVHGEAVFKKEEIAKAKGVDRALRIDRFEVLDGTVMVQVDAGRDTAFSLLGKAVADAALTDRIRLRSTDDQTFDPVGYWYEDDRMVKIRYTPDKPIRTQKALADDGVTLSRSRPDQRLYLLFTPSAGVEIARFTVGDHTAHEFKPALKIEKQR